jgi:hypothetical protein
MRAKSKTEYGPITNGTIKFIDHTNAAANAAQMPTSVDLVTAASFEPNRAVSRK